MFTEFQAKFLCASLMLAVKFLNENDIVHGSLMPKKIIFNDKYYPQIVSFPMCLGKWEFSWVKFNVFYSDKFDIQQF